MRRFVPHLAGKTLCGTSSGHDPQKGDILWVRLSMSSSCNQRSFSDHILVNLLFTTSSWWPPFPLEKYVFNSEATIMLSIRFVCRNGALKSAERPRSISKLLLDIVWKLYCGDYCPWLMLPDSAQSPSGRLDIVSYQADSVFYGCYHRCFGSVSVPGTVISDVRLESLELQMLL